MIINKGRIADAFCKSSNSYDEAAVVQREVIDRLVYSCEQILDPKHNRILEIGCGTGLLSEKFTQRFTVNEYFLNDLSQSLCERAEHKVVNNVLKTKTVAGDAEKIELPKQCDVILSSSTMQWFENIPAFISASLTHLVDNGYIAISLFTEGTMNEVKALTEKSLNYVSVAELQETLACGYKIKIFESVKKQLFFQNIKELLLHIKKTGAAGLPGSPLTITELRKFERDYVNCFQTKRGLPLTYSFVLAIAQKR